MIYLDNAATSFPKPDPVSKAVLNCMKKCCANPGRSGHSMAVASGRAVFEAREKVAGFFGIADPMRLCFTKNATEALNIAIKGCIRPGDHVITTSMEHNSVIRPLKTLESSGRIELTIIRCNELGELDPCDVERAIKANTRLIACTLSSNVNGRVMPVAGIARISRDNGLLFLLDASQGAGSMDIDVSRLNLDMMAFPGHKGMMGPQGTGGLYVRDGVDLNSFMEGGTGSNSENLYQPRIMPDMLESGTVNMPGIMGLAAAVDFIGSAGLTYIRSYKHMLLERLIDGMSGIDGLVIYSPKGVNENTGIAAVNFEGTDSSEVSRLLDREYSIATRAGLHCAPLAHKTLGTEGTGVVRFSPGCFNTIDEADYTIDAMYRIGYMLKKRQI